MRKNVFFSRLERSSRFHQAPKGGCDYHYLPHPSHLMHLILRDTSFHPLVLNHLLTSGAQWLPEPHHQPQFWLLLWSEQHENHSYLLRNRDTLNC